LNFTPNLNTAIADRYQFNRQSHQKMNSHMKIFFGKNCGLNRESHGTMGALFFAT